jgi:hypothetical protein
MSNKVQEDLASSAASVDNLIAGVAQITLTSSDLNFYLKAFGAIVAQAAEIRGEPIPQDELAVTKELASPFNTGGLLVLLWRPRNDHPWRDGIERVIKECHTFDALDEALQMVSNLSLREKVSVLDVEPFYNSKFKPTEEQKNMLNDLVFRAISAKRPKAILCMGNVRLNDRKDNDRIKLIT